MGQQNKVGTHRTIIKTDGDGITWVTYHDHMELNS